MSILCRPSLHNWNRKNAAYSNSGLVIRAEQRHCSRCGKTQVKQSYRHSGKNVVRWLDVKRKG